MTQITVPDHLIQDAKAAFPDEAIESLIARLLKLEIERRRQASGRRAQLDDVLEKIAAIQSRTKPLSNEEIRRRREEGRT